MTGTPSRPRVRRLINRYHIVQRLGQLVDHVTPDPSDIVIINRDNANGRIITQTVRGLDKEQGGPFVTVGYTTVPRRLLRDRLFNCIGNTFANTSTGNGAKLVRTTGANALFLSRVNSVPLVLRTGLLHTVRTHRVLPVNTDDPVRISVHVVSTAGRGLTRFVTRNGFHRSLFCQLGIVPVALPPLHRHRRSVRLLIRCFLRLRAHHLKSICPNVTPSIIRVLHGRH